MRIVYNNDPNAKNPITYNLNHNIKVIRKVTKELPTIENLPKGVKIIHRYNYAYNPNIPNTSRHKINETGKLPKKQVIVNKRKIDIIKTERKHIKIYSNTNQGIKKIPFSLDKKDKSNINIRQSYNILDQTKNKIGNKSRRSNNINKINLKEIRNTSSSSLIKSNVNNTNRNKVSEKTTRTTISEIRTSTGQKAVDNEGKGSIRLKFTKGNQSENEEELKINKEQTDGKIITITTTIKIESNDGNAFKKKC